VICPPTPIWKDTTPEYSLDIESALLNLDTATIGDTYYVAGPGQIDDDSSDDLDNKFKRQATGAQLLRASNVRNAYIKCNNMWAVITKGGKLKNVEGDEKTGRADWLVEHFLELNMPEGFLTSRYNAPNVARIYGGVKGATRTIYYVRSVVSTIPTYQ